LRERTQRAKLKPRRGDLTIAQGKRGTSATLGQQMRKVISLSPSDGERGQGEGLLNLTALRQRPYPFDMPTTYRMSIESDIVERVNRAASKKQIPISDTKQK